MHQSTKKMWFQDLGPKILHTINKRVLKMLNEQAKTKILNKVRPMFILDDNVL